MAIACPPPDSTSVTTALARSISSSTTATDAPSLARRRTMALPIPNPPPAVTIATLSSNVIMNLSLSKEWQAETVHLTDGKLVSRVEIDNGGRFDVVAHCRADFLVILVTAEFAELILVDV